MGELASTHQCLIRVPSKLCFVNVFRATLDHVADAIFCSVMCLSLVLELLLRSV